MNGQGFRAWPDRLYIFPNGVFFFIEYKRPGEVPSQAQTYLHQLLAMLGHRVYPCVDSVEDGKAIVDHEFNGTPLDLYVKVAA
jgi:hypothetical protein